jgi:NADH-quinone oxidoreductase subunit N
MFGGLIVIDPFAYYNKFLILLSIIIITLFLIFNHKLASHETYFILIPAMTLGSLLAVSSSNLAMLFVSLELINIALYFLLDLRQRVSVKFFIYGLISSGVMLYGISILYGISGSLNYYDISAFLSANAYNNLTLMIAFLLIMTGLASKMLLFPFNVLMPSTVEKSSQLESSLMLVPVVITGFAVTIRFFLTVFHDNSSFVQHENTYHILNSFKWDLLLAVLSAASVITGNFIILWQTNLKRIITFTSIAGCGYLLMGLAAASKQGTASVLIGLVIYSINTLGLIICTGVIETKFKITDITHIKGLRGSSKFIAIAMTVFIISSIGLPLSSGFIMKLFLFTSVLSNGYYALLVIGILSTMPAVYFYFKLITSMFQSTDSEKTIKADLETGAKIILLILLIPAILLGFYFNFMVEFAGYGAKIFGL